MDDTTVLPGMEVAVRGDPFAIRRGAPNLWWVSTAWAAGVREPLDAVIGAATATASPATVLAGAPGSSATVAKLELDECGAWCTVANAGDARPLLVRRAGWVDVRGHPAPATGERLFDDRIGLGPGDALVFVPVPCSDELLDALLAVAGRGTDDVAAAIADVTAVLGVLAVPADLGRDPKQRLVRATGLTLDQLALPGYAHGDLQPELWAEPPRPPRLARLRLSRDATTVRAVRSLLDRLLASWRLDDRIDRDIVKLAASELATNAILHTGEPEAATIRYLGSVVRIEVDDRSPVMPAPRVPEPAKAGGRGLPIVGSVAASWGAEARAQGKRVWCELAVTP